MLMGRGKEERRFSEPLKEVVKEVTIPETKE